MYARAASVYRRVDLDSAPKPQILDQLFARMLTDLDTARRAIAARDITAKAQSIDHALQIVGELRSALDHAAAPELCANLSSLYAYMIDQMTRASAKLDTKALDHVSTVATQLRQTFADAAYMAANPGAPPPNPPPAAKKPAPSGPPTAKRPVLRK